MLLFSSLDPRYTEVEACETAFSECKRAPLRADDGKPEVGLLERHGLHGLLLPNAVMFSDSAQVAQSRALRLASFEARHIAGWPGQIQVA